MLILNSYFDDVPRAALYQWTGKINFKLTVLTPFSHYIESVENLELNLGFNFEDSTEAYGSCSVVFKNRMMVFGGYAGVSAKQIAEVKSCSLEKVGVLSFEFYYGACGTYDFSTEEVLLCFPSDGRSCWKFTESYVTEDASSTFKHVYSTLGTYDDKPVGIAGYFTNEVEMYSNNEWSMLAPISDVPRVHEFSTITRAGILYVFGGADGATYQSNVWEYNGQWKLGGSLLLTRTGHRSIIVNDTIIHVGGTSNEIGNYM